MSYTIVYDRQVIKTPSGFSFVLLMGDNNVWEAGSRRRARHWSCILLNESEENCIKFFEGWCGGPYQQHFKWQGHYLDDAGLMRWVKNGIKNAHTIEELGKPLCQLNIWDGVDKLPADCKEYIDTTEDFERWANTAKSLSDKYHIKYKSVFFSVDFFTSNPLNVAKRLPPLTGPIIAKWQKKYLSSFDKNGFTFSPQISDAYIFSSYQELQELLGERIEEFGRSRGRASTIRKMTFHNADKLLKSDAAKQYVIAITNRYGEKNYFVRATKYKYRLSWQIKAAARFTEAGATKRVKTLFLNKEQTAQVEKI